MSVRVRFAPSPTGYLHIGGARTALFNWLFARHHGGTFILRIEDTDQKRTVPGALEEQMAALRWLGLNWDEGPDVGGPHEPYIQSQRVELYQQWAAWLLDRGHAYKCFATPEELEEMRQQQMARSEPVGYDRRYRNTPPEEIARLEAEGRPYVIRFKMPLEGTTTLQDAVRGPIEFDNRHLTDLVLLKADGFPTYHLANVVDDHYMKITHILRADEWLASGPLHVNIYAALGWDLPVYAHLPVVLSPSGKGKLSKRDQAFQDDGVEILVQVREFRRAGYLPEALVNFLTNVGWSSGDDDEKFTAEEAIAKFDIGGINPAPAKLPYSKLEWLNGQYIQEVAPEELARRLKPFLEEAGFEVNLDALLAVAPAIAPRLKRLSEAAEWLEFLFGDEIAPVEPEQLVHKKLPLAAALDAYRRTRDFARETETWDLESISTHVTEIGESATLNGKAGPFLGRLRIAITGQNVSPPVFESMLALGRERVMRRLGKLIEMLESNSASVE